MKRYFLSPLSGPRTFQSTSFRRSRTLSFLVRFLQLCVLEWKMISNTPPTCKYSSCPSVVFFSPLFLEAGFFLSLLRFRPLSSFLFAGDWTLSSLSPSLFVARDLPFFGWAVFLVVLLLLCLLTPSQGRGRYGKG